MDESEVELTRKITDCREKHRRLSDATRPDVSPVTAANRVQVLQEKIRKANLRTLPLPHQRLYEIGRIIGPATGAEMRAAYRKYKTAIFEGRGHDPSTWRRAWDYLSKMADYDLIDMSRETNSKVYEAIDQKLEAPVEFDSREDAKLY